LVFFIFSIGIFFDLGQSFQKIIEFSIENSPTSKDALSSWQKMQWVDKYPSLP